MLEQYDLFHEKSMSNVPHMQQECDTEYSYFAPERIVLAKGSMTTPQRRALVTNICAQFPEAQVEHCPDIPHNKIMTTPVNDAYTRHLNSKKTLVLGVLHTAVRYSAESGNTCPNYWHYSVFGFCPYGCSYCYLAGTPGVFYAPAVKIYVNLPEIIETINRQAYKCGAPTSFYHGKLQDGLALEPITGYMQTLIPFFARHQFARNIILTKSDTVHSLLPLEHNGHTVLSWSLNPPEVVSMFESNTPPVLARIAAMKQCAEAGYPVRAVLMPVIPVPGWENIYGEFIEYLLTEVPLSRLTIGGICSYSNADSLMKHHIGDTNAISMHMRRDKSAGDGRRRYDAATRISMYRCIVAQVRHIRKDLPIALCLEEPDIWRAVDPELRPGSCNCVW